MKPIGSTKTAAVFVDDWKLPVFERMLKEQGYQYTQQPGLTEGTTLLTVTYEYAAKLHALLTLAQAECKKGTKP